MMDRKWFGLGMLLVVFAFFACNLPGVAPGTEPGAGEGEPPPGPTSEIAPTTAAPGTPRPADRDDVLIWFSPHPYRPNSPRGDLGSVDFMDLFEDGAPWMEAAGRVDVLKLYGGWVARGATEADLRKIVSFADRHGMKLGFEAGPLPPRNYCKSTTPPEGFAGVKEGRNIARNMKEAGGTFDYLAFDAAIANSHLNQGPVGCQWPLERVARETQEYVEFFRSEFPGIVIGDTDPLWEGADVQTYKDWIRIYEEVTGEPLAFFHQDTQWSRSTWPQDAREIEQYADSLGVDYGIIYFGDVDDISDAAWLDKAEERMVTFESLVGGTPDHVLLQSWHERPDRALPETDPNTFTNLINRYFRGRTDLTVEADGPGGRISASGALRSDSGEARAGTTIAYEIVPLSGSGVSGQAELTGEVPAGATQANIGLRVNRECGCSSPVQLKVYGATYTEGEGANLVPNPSFAGGPWGNNGDATLRLTSSDEGSGRMMVIEADEGQGLIVNGTRFNVTPGAEFTLRFEAKVAPESVGGGYFAIFFLGPEGEFKRERIPFEPAAASQGSVETDAGGRYEFSAGDLPDGDYEVRLRAEGDEDQWPAMAEAQVTVSP